MKKCLLVTAFMPFGGDEINPTEAVLAALPSEMSGFVLKKLLLPVVFGRAAETACAEYDRLSPAAVIRLGQAGGRGAITPEAVGRNLMNAGIPDNDGNQPVNEPISVGAADELYSTFPAEGIAESIRALGISAEVSRDAGLYVCNYLLYGMLLHDRGAVPTGFIHVPFIREQVEGIEGREKLPFMELETVIKGITAAIEKTAAAIRSPN